MPIVLAQVRIPMDSAIPADDVVNTFHFQAATGTAAALAAAAHAKLTTFYQAIDNQIYPGEVGATATVKYYDIDELEPRAPILTDTIALTTGAADGLPHEVAVCLSFQAEQVSGVNQARRRNRVFLGPIRDTGKAVVSSKVRVLDTMRTAITTAAAALAATGGGAQWIVFSDTIWQATPTDFAWDPVDNGWVDDAFDTMRSRGEDPSTRTTFAV